MDSKAKPASGFASEKILEEETWWGVGGWGQQREAEKYSEDKEGGCK